MADHNYTEPQAFPTILTEDSTDYFGMTLRDWFAGQALGSLSVSNYSKLTAEQAWKISDAMMAERFKRGLT